MSADSTDDPNPLVGYAVVTAAFNGLAAAYATAHRRSGRELPPKLPVGDFMLLAARTQKLSRVISKDRVTSFLRSPFTRYQSEAGPSEVSEEPRGTGVRLAIGELLARPYWAWRTAPGEGHRYDDPCWNRRPNYKRHQRLLGDQPGDTAGAARVATMRVIIGACRDFRRHELLPNRRVGARAGAPRPDTRRRTRPVPVRSG